MNEKKRISTINWKWTELKSDMAMAEHYGNIVLIGMPGSGKSTVGVILAKMTGRDFIDTDILINVSQGRSLQDIIDKDGYMALRRIEEEIICGLTCTRHVIATGGSAVYSTKTMQHLKSGGDIILLDVDLHTLKDRVRDFDTRGVAKRPDQTYADIFVERVALYRKNADITIDCAHLSHEEVCSNIIKRLKK